MEKLNYRMYLTTLKMVFLKAVHDLYPEHEVVFLNSLNNGLYGKILWKHHVFHNADYDKIKQRMKEIIEANLPIQIVSSNYEAIKLSSIEKNREDIQELMNTTLWTGIMKMKLDDYSDYFYHLPYESTGSLDAYDIYPYSAGFILKYPMTDPHILEQKIDPSPPAFNLLPA